MFGPVHRTASGALSAAGRFGDAPVDRHIGQVQTDQPFVGGQHRAAQPIEQSGGDYRELLEELDGLSDEEVRALLAEEQDAS